MSDTVAPSDPERPAFTVRGAWALVPPEPFGLFLISVLLLFFELALIRWVSASVRVVAYFSNIVLIACFLGTGLGCIYADRRRLFRFFPWLQLALLVLCWHLGEHGIDNPFQGSEYIFGGGGRYAWLAVVPVIFILTALAFVSLGQKLGEAFRGLTPLRGYSINIFGSLAGTVAFGAASFFGLPPLAWFSFAALLTLALLRRRVRDVVIAAVPLAATLLLVAAQQRPFLWSPYYKIEVFALEGEPGGNYRIQVNDDYHQFILGLDPASARRDSSLEPWRRTYDLPYHAAPLTGERRVLVLGAGGGNDVAAALRNGATRVDAVELDPVIADLGRRLHPERPYDDARVRLITTDARAFLATATDRYDLIVLGWLDSHRLFSSMSNVRQDNFVYTVEAMQRARELLRPQGALVLSFYVGQPWLGAKIDAMLTRAFGHAPRVFALAAGGYGADGAIFVITKDPAGAISDPGPGFVEQTETMQALPPVPPPTDRWPYLYYRERQISGQYVVVLASLLAVSCLLVGPALRGSRLAGREAIHFFVLGAAFLLLEVRNITSLALVFGSTWLVTSIVIAVILAMILVANLLVHRGLAPPVRVLWFLLYASVTMSALWSWVGASVADVTTKALATSLVVSATFVFAGIVFAGSFARTTQPAAALGFNVLGAVVGGLAEYASLVVGIDGLVVIALVFYALAMLTRPVSTAAA